MTKGYALTTIEHGEIVKGKNTVSVFAPGDAISLPDEVFAQLEAGKAVSRETPARAEPTATGEPVDPASNPEN